MTQRPPARIRASAQRFLTRRMEHALVCHDDTIDDAPLRAQSRSLAAGCVLAAIVVAGCALLSVVRPQGTPGQAPIIMARESGAVYVRVGDTWHPAFNLASAHLAARSAAAPVVVAESSVAGLKRGSTIGIPGAPPSLGVPLPATPWSVCDGNRTVVVAGPSPARGSNRLVLVTPRGESAATTYLLYDGWRAAVDLRDRAVVQALHLDGVDPISVSRALLDIVPEAPAVATPPVPGFGAAGPQALGGNGIGTVLRVVRTGSDEFYVVLADGVQRIGEVAADVIRFGYRGPAELPTVTPAEIARVPAVTGLPVGRFPPNASPPVGAQTGAVVCAQWNPGDADAPTTTAIFTDRATTLDGLRAGEFVQADGSGPLVDGAVLPAGRTGYLRSARTFGDDGATGPRFLVTDSGVAYGVRDDDAAKYLGLTAPPEPVPWSILAHLPAGPELSTDAASVLRDGVAPPT
jgi:type VII secretion protein EccB